MLPVDPAHRKRCKRYDTPWDAHYLTFSCFQRRAFLSRPRACQWLLDAIQAARVRRPFDLWAFVFMPEHAHFLIWPHEGVRISDILLAVKQPVAQRCIAWVKRNPPGFLGSIRDEQPNGEVSFRFWQRGGGYDRNLWSAREIHEKVRYIHNNPVRRELVARAEDWKWSSFRAWESGIDDLIPLDRNSVPTLGP
jgi:putative transposase